MKLTPTQDAILSYLRNYGPSTLLQVAQAITGTDKKGRRMLGDAVAWLSAENFVRFLSYDPNEQAWTIDAATSEIPT